MKKNNSKNIIIGVLSLLVVGMTIITILSLNGTISLSSNLTEETKNNQNVEDTTNNEENNETVQIKTNNVIEKYIGKWILGDGSQGTYTNINIEKSSNSKTGYSIDILVNKEADYSNLELYCADNSGVCYAIGDENHHFSIVMANELVMVTPDYAVQGTSWNFGSQQ